jgi:hypothetical protein
LKIGVLSGRDKVVVLKPAVQKRIILLKLFNTETFARYCIALKYSGTVADALAIQNGWHKDYLCDYDKWY